MSAEIVAEVMSTPRISVVMSVYNDAERVARAIDSLLSQTCSDFELIVVDDGSTDSTPMVLDKYHRLDSRIRIVTQKNTGLTRALIRGCNEARGEFIARQDADDWSQPNRLATQLRTIEADPTLGFVACATQFVGPNGELLNQVVRSPDPDEATRRLLDEKCGPPAHGSVMFRRSVYQKVGGYRAEFYYGQDADLWLRMAEHSRFVCCQELLYTYRRDLHAISGRMGNLQKQFGDLGQACRSVRRVGKSDEPLLANASYLANRIRSRKQLTRFSASASSMAYLIGSSLVKQGQSSARPYLWQAICLNPLNWRAWFRLIATSLRIRGPRTSQQTKASA